MPGDIAGTNSYGDTPLLKFVPYHDDEPRDRAVSLRMYVLLAGGPVPSSITALRTLPRALSTSCS
jgi:hypothetical protein